MPSVGTVIGRIKCRVTGKIFPLYKYIQLKSGIRMYQITPENCQEEADYIVWGLYIALHQNVENLDADAFALVRSKDLLSSIEFPPNFILLGDWVIK